ncbi:two-component regulator propeller domain-containing protein [Mucilaginibacter pocheonensis]
MNQVNSIYNDARGFMWFGTGPGRYEGHAFKVYKKIK